MILKGRIKLIADMIPKCTIVSDIGTDHAYIPIYCVKNQICERAIACDIGKGPVAVADKNIKRYCVEDKVQTRIGSGIKPVLDNELDVVVIAGMGGILICEILADDINKAKTAKSLVIQPMNYSELVREWLYQNGFEIYDEALIDEGFRIYNVIVTRWTGVVAKKENVYYHIGEKLIEKDDPLLVRYIDRRIRLADKVLDDMKAMEDQGSDLIIAQKNIRSQLSKLRSTIIEHRSDGYGNQM